ncbi:autotransporter assembly complex family protein [Amorphus sp. 3PC139-8]|uniref:autotransporter assembly complex protein TamA n=1 Tax=Amorphus sp. 3PC139-8 TaxID=2735676 RepID=UPI00345D5420
MNAIRLPTLAFAWAAGFAAALAPAPAAAFELFGIKLFGSGSDDAETTDVIGEPQPYDVTFDVPGDTDVESSLKGASSLWRDRKRPASGAAGLLAKARGDYRNLVYALYANARYGGTVSITIDGQQAADLPFDATFPDTADVRISVDPGPLFLFDKATIRNQAPYPTNRRDVVPTPESGGFQTGQPARSTVILQAEARAVEAWRQQGYAKAKAGPRHVSAVHPSDTVNAELEMEPGRKAYFGPTSVSGTKRMDPDFVAYMAGFKQGEEFDPDAVQRASDRLAKLDVFSSLRVEENETIEPDGSLPMHVIVRERKLHRIGVGGSFSSIDGLGLEAYWLHRNLFGRAEQLRIDGKVANFDNKVDPEDFTYRAGATFTKPGVGTPDSNFVASIYGEREVLDTYTKTGVSGQAGINHQFSKELSARGFLTGQVAEFEDDVYGTRDFTTGGFLGAFTYDSRNDPTNATRGHYVDVTALPFYEFNYANAASRFTAEARTYYAVDGDNRIVLAARGKIGTLVGPSIAELPPDLLFFAGGGGSVRGYPYRSIGVDVGNNVVGGKSLLEGSFEVRGRFTQTIGAVAFLDAGLVGADSTPDFDQDVKLGAGVGLRYFTSVGAIRLDVAVPLEQRDGEPSVAFYVGIGQAF